MPHRGAPSRQVCCSTARQRRSCASADRACFACSPAARQTDNNASWRRELRGRPPVSEVALSAASMEYSGPGSAGYSPRRSSRKWRRGSSAPGENGCRRGKVAQGGRVLRATTTQMPIMLGTTTRQSPTSQQMVKEKALILAGSWASWALQRPRRTCDAVARPEAFTKSGLVPAGRQRAAVGGRKAPWAHPWPVLAG